MKYALLLHGCFRNFKTSLPQILQYISFEKRDFDVFILSSKVDGYSVKAETELLEMLNDKVKIIQYTEDYPEIDKANENKCVEIYNHKRNQAINEFNMNFASKDMVPRFLYRLSKLSKIFTVYRQSQKIDYDWVIRSRLDVGFFNKDKPQVLSQLDDMPEKKTIYHAPDIFSAGDISTMYYEMKIIDTFPYLFISYCKNTDENGIGHFNTSFRLHSPNKSFGEFNKLLNNWLFMPEINLIYYMADAGYTRIFIRDLIILR